MINTRIFRHDDYSEIQQKYFAGLRTSGNVDADPSGWLSTYSLAEEFAALPTIKPRDLARYYIDEGDSLGADKIQISNLISMWEGYSVPPNQITLCPSGASISLVTLSALKASGVKRILFETPAYFGTIEQAQQIGLAFDLLPTYRSDEYVLPDLGEKLPAERATAVWLTQPRASLGFDQPHNQIINIVGQLGKSGYLVIDEATDQSFPAHLGEVRKCHPGANIIRLRSFVKGMGLNGLRLAGALHPPALRGVLADCIEALGGSLDIHSLRAVGMMANDPNRLRAMLYAANKQVNALRQKAEKMVIGTPLRVNRLTNGYIGTMVADLSSLGRNQNQQRVRLLAGCRKARTPVILGSSMYMAKDPPLEAIRLNFFSEQDHILRGIANILTIWD